MPSLNISTLMVVVVGRLLLAGVVVVAVVAVVTLVVVMGLPCEHHLDLLKFTVGSRILYLGIFRFFSSQ